MGENLTRRPFNTIQYNQASLYKDKIGFQMTLAMLFSEYYEETLSLGCSGPCVNKYINQLSIDGLEYVTCPTEQNLPLLIGYFWHY